MKETWILGIQINDLVSDTNDIQSVLTKFGCTIKTRLGLHEVTGEQCSRNGIIILELTGNKDEYYKLESALSKIEGLTVKKMVFESC